MKKVRTIEKRAEMLEALEEVGDGISEVAQEHGEPSLTKAIPVPEFSTLMEQMVARENMLRAYQRVMRNKGAAGIDSRSVNELKAYLDKHWVRIKKELVKGTYQPQKVRRVEIPKPNGGKRQLGIPTVADRLIQQAMQQVLSPIFESGFSEHSYGFRPRKSAQKAVQQAQKYQTEGRRWLVDIDLEQFFDQVNHDRLMSRIAKQVKDPVMLKLIRKYLRTEVMVGGVHTRPVKGTPQGSPLSPLLSNIVLDELDKELESRKLKFCRYADDCNIYVRSQKAAERVMRSIKEFIEHKLRLKVNEKKSVVSRPWKRVFLGYSFTSNRKPKIRVPQQTQQKMRAKLKELFRKGRGRNIARLINETLVPVLRGWINYFKLAEVKEFAEKLDEWIRRRIRLIIWRQWKRPWRRYKGLLKAGLPQEQARQSAFNGRGAWWNSGAKHMNIAFRKNYFVKLGLFSLSNKLKEFRNY